MTQHYAIFDTNVGMLQWSGVYASAADALSAFDAMVGLGESGITDLEVYALTAAELSEVEAWSAAGSPARQTPVCLQRCNLVEA